jgi:hypothetical protein
VNSSVLSYLPVLLLVHRSEMAHSFFDGRRSALGQGHAPSNGIAALPQNYGVRLVVLSVVIAIFATPVFLSVPARQGADGPLILVVEDNCVKSNDCFAHATAFGLPRRPCRRRRKSHGDGSRHSV